MSPQVRRVYLDANMLIYMIDGTVEHMARATAIVASFQADSDMFSSEITLGECLRGALRQSNRGSASNYLSVLENEDFITLEPVSLSIIRRAAHLGAELNMKLIDAIHVATAETLRCSVFLTNDRGIRAPAGIEFRYLTDGP
jgi:predicted nucleic acid-binding protein